MCCAFTLPGIDIGQCPAYVSHYLSHNKVLESTWGYMVAAIVACGVLLAVPMAFLRWHMKASELRLAVAKHNER